MMQVEKVKYFSVTVFIIKDFCTVQTFPLLLAYLIIRFLKLRAELVCCAKTCFWTIRRSDLENEIHFSKCSILLSNSIGFRTLNFSKGFLDNGILTLVKYLLIKVVAPLGHEQLLCPLSSSFKSNGPDTKMGPTDKQRQRTAIPFQFLLTTNCLIQWNNI